MLRAALTFILLCAVAGIYIPALAQTSSLEPLSLVISPKHPRPYDLVTVSVSSNLVDLAASAITISADGKVVAEGSRSASLQLGGAGSKTAISVTAVTNGKTYTRSLTIRPADVALILEPDTSAHPFYEGGRLVAPQSRVRLIAIADLRTTAGARIPDAQLAYTWKLGNKVLRSESGLGKSVLRATAPVRYRDAEISLTVSSQDSLQVAEASLFVSPVTPLVRIYRSNPLGGTDYGRALGDSFSLSSNEETFEAVPYFFSSTPDFLWQLNGNPSGSQNKVTVRTTGTKVGSALLGVTARERNSGEQAQSRFTVQFGNSSANIFGF